MIRCRHPPPLSLPTAQTKRIQCIARQKGNKFRVGFTMQTQQMGRNAQLNAITTSMLKFAPRRGQRLVAARFPTRTDAALIAIAVGTKSSPSVGRKVLKFLAPSMNSLRVRCAHNTASGLLQTVALTAVPTASAWIKMQKLLAVRFHLMTRTVTIARKNGAHGIQCQFMNV